MAEQWQLLPISTAAAVRIGMRPGDVAATVECRRAAGRGLELLLWLEDSMARRYVAAGGFWTDMHLGEPCWVRFAFEFTAVGRSAFSAAEVLPARGQAQRPPGEWLLASGPLVPPSGATS